MIREGDVYAGSGGVDFGGEMGWLFGFADAVEAAGFLLGAGPGEHAAAVELAVFGMEAAAHDAGGELFEGEFAEAALTLAVDGFMRDDVDFPVAVRKI